MAGGEKYIKGTLSQVSWADGVSLDQYYGLQNSFQYAENLNCDDEMHGLKLAQKMGDSSALANCQLVSKGDAVYSLNMTTGEVRKFNDSNRGTGGEAVGSQNVSPSVQKNVTYTPGVMFQDYFRYGVQTTSGNNNYGGLVRVPNAGSYDVNKDLIVPQDHLTEDDEDLIDPNKAFGMIGVGITAILNYNNSLLVVAAGQDLRVYYPQIETEYMAQTPTPNPPRGKVGWKKVMTFENGSSIIALTCTFEYLKVRVVDEGWNTKVYYYQGNNNLKSTFVYNVVDLTNTKVLRVYSVNGTDYYTASLDGTVNYITLNKMIGNVPVQLLKQRAGLVNYDVNYKDPYFVGPSGMDAPYLDGKFYIADAYGTFQFEYDPQSYDKGYMKRKKTTKSAPAGVAICKNFLYVSDQEGIHKVRLYDTGVDGYQNKGIMISRELEGEYGGCVTKMLDEVRMHFELLPEYLASGGTGNGSIDVYVSPNNIWQYHDPETNSAGRWHVMHIDSTNYKTRTEQINRLNSMDNGAPAFEFDRQTITYCIVIKKGTIAQATPIVRELNLRYQLKGKTNYVYEIK